MLLDDSRLKHRNEVKTGEEHGRAVRRPLLIIIHIFLINKKEEGYFLILKRKCRGVDTVDM